MTLNYIHLVDIIPTISELLDSPIFNFIALAANDFVYSGNIEDLIINYVHPLLLKSKAASSQEDNPNWRNYMNDQFSDEYWEAAVT